MNKNEIKKLLDKTDIYVLDEINILEYIDELEQIKEDYIKSLDKLDVLENRNNKAIKKLNSAVDHYEDLATDWALKCAIKILRGEDNG